MMGLDVRAMTRWCVAKQQPDTSIKALKRMHDDDKCVEHGFLTKRHDVAVHAIYYNSSLQTPRGIEYASCVARDTQAAGLDGLVFYENAGYQRMNAEEHTMVVGHADHAIRATADSV